MKDNFLLKQLAQAVVDSFEFKFSGLYSCTHCNSEMDSYLHILHKPHCIVLVAEQILEGNEDE